MKVYRCRWCGKKVNGLRRLFHNPKKCKMRPSTDGGGWKSVLEQW